MKKFIGFLVLLVTLVVSSCKEGFTVSYLNDVADNIVIEYQEGDSESHVTKDIVLPSTVVYENHTFKIYWSTSNHQIINLNGKVSPLIEDSLVTLTAQIQSSSSKTSVIFVLSVIGYDKYLDLRDLEILNENPSYLEITTDLLFERSIGEFTLDYEVIFASQFEVISNNGNVIRPPYNTSSSGYTEVTVKVYEVSNPDDRVLIKTFDLRVLDNDDATTVEEFSVIVHYPDFDITFSNILLGTRFIVPKFEDNTNTYDFFGWYSDSLLTDEITTRFITVTQNINIYPKVLIIDYITVENSKPDYFVSESFDYSSIVVTAHYTNGFSQTLAQNSYTLIGFDSSEAGSLIVTIEYIKRYDTFEVVISNAVISSIEIDTSLVKKDYIEGQNLDLSNLIVWAVFNDSSKFEVSSYSVSLYDKYQIGSQEVTITYNDFSETFNVLVVLKSLVSISLNVDEVKTNYYVNETLNHDNLIVTALYDNNTTEEVIDYSIDDILLTSSGVKTVTITYLGKTNSYVVNVIDVIVISITLDSSNVKKNYNIGQVLETTNLIVYLNYNNDTTTVLEDTYQTSLLDTSTIGTKRVTITYEGHSASYYVVVSVQLADLIISEYAEGTSNNKWIEIYNGTGSDVNLKDYQLLLFANGLLEETGTEYLSGILPNGKFAVYYHSSTNSTISNIITSNPNVVIKKTTSAVNFNGDDAIALVKGTSNEFVDIFGKIGERPTDAWGEGKLTRDHTLVRKDSVTSGITQIPASFDPTIEWEVLSVDFALNIGYRNATDVIELIITPPTLLVYPALTETIDLTGLVVKARLANGEPVKTISDTEYEIEEYSLEVAGNVTITISYNGVSSSFDVTVLNYYNLNVSSQENGTVSSNVENGSYEETTAISLEAIPNSNYSFVGWYTNITLVSSSNPYEFELNSNTTLTARFELVKHTVNFVYDELSHSQLVEHGQNANVPTLTDLEHYVFDGWYTEELGEGDKYVNFNNITASITAYAHYVKKSYTITFDLGYETSSFIPSVTREYNTIYQTVKPEDPTRTGGFSFLHWEYEDNSHVNWAVDKFESNITIIAIWTEQTRYTVTIKYENGDEDGNEYIIENEYYSKPVTPPVKEHYTFSYWTYDVVLGVEVEWDSNTIQITEDVTIVANYLENIYYVEYYNDTEEIEALKTPYSISSIPSLDLPSYDVANYRTDGWYLSDSFEATKLESLEGLLFEETILKIYVKLVEQITVSFVSNYALLDIESQTIDKDSTLSELDLEYDEIHYILSGWYSSPDLNYGSIIDLEDTISETVVLYAKWSVNNPSEAFTSKIKPVQEIAITTNLADGAVSSNNFGLSLGYQVVDLDDAPVEIKYIKNSAANSNIFNNRSAEGETQFRLYKSSADSNGGALEITITSGYIITGYIISTTQNGGASINGGTKITTLNISNDSVNLNSLTIKNVSELSSNNQIRIDYIRLTYVKNASINEYEFTPTINGSSTANINNVKSNLTLNNTTVPFASVAWESSNTELISNSGVYSEPVVNSGDNEVRVTAKVTINGIEDTYEFILTLPSKYSYTFTDGSNNTNGSNFLDSILEAPTPNTPAGHTFVGWFDSEEGGEEITSFVLTEGFIAYARYEINSYIVNFVIDGIDNEQSVDFGSPVTPPNVDKAHYSFLGWFDEEVEGEEVNDFSNIIGALTVYAYYEINSYLLSFDVDGGTPEIVSVTRVYGTLFSTIKPSDPSKGGFSFVKWIYEDLTPVSWDTDIFEDNLTIKAQWTVDVIYNVTIKYNNGNENSIVPVIDGQYLTIPSNPTKQYYSFVKWIYEGLDDVVWDENKLQITSHITIEAIYNPITYTVKYFDEAEELIDLEQQFTVLTSKPSLETYSKEGYSFKGWFNQELSVQYLSINSNEDYELYAKTIELVTVSFVTNYTGLAVTSQTIDKDTQLSSLSYSIVIPSEYYLVGWYTNSSLTSSFDVSEDVVEENTTLYAKWGFGDVNDSINIDFESGFEKIDYSILGTTQTINGYDFKIRDVYYQIALDASDKFHSGKGIRMRSTNVGYLQTNFTIQYLSSIDFYLAYYGAHTNVTMKIQISKNETDWITIRTFTSLTNTSTLYSTNIDYSSDLVSNAGITAYDNLYIRFLNDTSATGRTVCLDDISFNSRYSLDIPSKANTSLTYSPGDSSSRVTDDVTLVNGYASVPFANVIWESSNALLIDDNGTYYPKTSYFPDTEVTLTAHIYLNGVLSYSKEIKVTYTGYQTITFYDSDNTELSSILVLKGSDYTSVASETEPIPNEGYHFAGWYDQLVDGTLINFSSVTTNISAYARYQINSYTITFTGANTTTPSYNHFSKITPLEVEEGYENEYRIGGFTINLDEYIVTNEVTIDVISHQLVKLSFNIIDYVTNVDTDTEGKIIYINPIYGSEDDSLLRTSNVELSNLYYVYIPYSKISTLTGYRVVFVVDETEIYSIIVPLNDVSPLNTYTVRFVDYSIELDSIDTLLQVTLNLFNNKNISLDNSESLISTAETIYLELYNDDIYVGKIDLSSYSIDLTSELFEIFDRFYIRFTNSENDYLSQVYLAKELNTLNVLTNYQEIYPGGEGTPSSPYLFTLDLGESIPANITLSFNLGEYSGTPYDGTSEIASQSGSSPLSISKPSNPTWNEYLFIGWFDEEDELFDDWSSPISQDLVLTANWILDFVINVTAPTKVTYTTADSAFDLTGFKVEKLYSYAEPDEIHEGYTITPFSSTAGVNKVATVTYIDSYENVRTDTFTYTVIVPIPDPIVITFTCTSGTTAFTTTNFLTAITSAQKSLITSVDPVSNTYPGSAGASSNPEPFVASMNNMIKMSSSGNGGNFKLNFSSTILINKVVVNADGWPNDTTITLAINGGTAQSIAKDNTWNPVDYTFIISTPSSSLNFVAVKRLVIVSITVHYTLA